MLNHYLSILLDKVFDLVITLIVVDRLLAWRERRRWRHVRRFVELQIEAALGDELRAWSKWLTSLRLNGKKIILSKDAKAALKEDQINATTVLPPEDFEYFVELCAGEPVPVVGEKSFVDSTNPHNFHRELLGYLVNYSLDGANEAWKTLIINLQSLVPRLADLVARLPAEKATNDEIRFKQFVEEQSLVIRKLDPSLYNTELWDAEFTRLDRMADIARLVLGSMLLIRVFRTSRL